MGRDTLTLRPADGDDLAYVEGLLDRNDLPAGDVRESPGAFYVAYGGDGDGDDRLGVGGIERYGSVGLLRSVVIEREFRGRGFGTALREELEAAARSDGIETLYLLTTTAADFFADAGYEPIERADAPEAIRRTTEFEDLCPSTATCMARSL